MRRKVKKDGELLGCIQDWAWHLRKFLKNKGENIYRSVLMMMSRVAERLNSGYMLHRDIGISDLLSGNEL